MSEAGRILLAELLERSHCGDYLRRSRSLSGLVVLNYHRIGSAASSPFDHGLWSATEEDFDQQIAFLKSNFDVISPADLEEAVKYPTNRTVLITFDDGYADNYTAAFSSLRRHQLPALFFLSTGFLDSPRISWWDEIAWMLRTTSRASIDASPWNLPVVNVDRANPESAIRRFLRLYKQLPGEQSASLLDFLAEVTGVGRATPELAQGMWMTWDMVREMHASGMSIGGHTVNHPILARLSAEEQHFEITRSCQRIAEELSSPPEFFSYPVGGTTAFNADTFAALDAANIRFAFTYGFGGYVRPSNLPYEIPRLPVESDLNLNRFRALATLPGLFSS